MKDFKVVECMACEFGEVREKEVGVWVDHGLRYDHFTVGEGKAKYHIMHIPDGGCGLHYGYRVGNDGVLEGRRPLEPTQKIRIHFYKT